MGGIVPKCPMFHVMRRRYSEIPHQQERSLPMKRLLGVLAFLVVSFPVSAGMIATPVDTERARVKAMLERPELQAEMQKMGIVPQEAVARVDAMNDAEVLQLAGKLDRAAAGGQVGDRTLLLILLIILLILII